MPACSIPDMPALAYNHRALRSAGVGVTQAVFSLALTLPCSNPLSGHDVIQRIDAESLTLVGLSSIVHDDPRAILVACLEDIGRQPPVPGDELVHGVSQLAHRCILLDGSGIEPICE